MDGSTYAMATRTTWANNRNTDLAGGTAVGYDGAQPAGPDTAIGGGNHALVTVAILNTAGLAGTVVNDLLTLSAMAAVLIARTGVLNWMRFFTPGGVALVDGPACNQTVTLTAGAALNAVTLVVSALTKPLYAGMDLWFNDGGALKKASVSVDAIVGATSVTVSPLAAAISNGSSNVYVVTVDAPSLTINASIIPGTMTLQAPGSN